MDTDARRLMRAVVRRVHPDLFAAHPYERQRNSESLKALNAYVDALAAAAGARRAARREGVVASGNNSFDDAGLPPPPRATTVEFWVRSSPSSLPGSAQSSFQEEEERGDPPPPPPPPSEQLLTRIVATLPSSGSLAPLFFAFGLITDAELRAGAGGIFGSGSSSSDTDFLEWLRETVCGAVAAAERHERLKRRIREARAALEHRHGLASLRAGAGDYAAGPGEQRRQLAALRALGAAMAALAADGEEGAATEGQAAAEGLFAGLSVHVHYAVAAAAPSASASREEEEEEEFDSEDDEDEEEVGAAEREAANGQQQQQQQQQQRRRRRSEARALEDEQQLDDNDDLEDDDDPTYTSSYIADDGCLHLFARGKSRAARRASLRRALARLDLPRARALAQASMFWLRRVRELAPVVRSLLRVENVWCDTRTEQNAQNFVLWAGYLLEQREAAAEALSAALGSSGGDANGNNGNGNGNGYDDPSSTRFSFSLLVHSDPDASPIDFSPASSILQVRSDCAPRDLVAFLVSEAGAAADAAAQRASAARQEEQELLERVRQAFGAKHVVRVCAARDPGLVLEGARRLLEAAPAVREAGVDLRGASLALDDCYEVWGSGFISIPYDFALQELRPQLARLLQAAAVAGATSEGEAAAAVGGGGGRGGGGRGGDGTAAGAFFGGGRGGGGAARRKSRPPLPTVHHHHHRHRAGGIGSAAAVGGRRSRTTTTTTTRRRAAAVPVVALARVAAATATAATAPRRSLLRLF
jgi:hypothetical protein